MSTSSRVVWRWAEKDFGFRFLSGSGKRLAEYYQARKCNEFYHVPASQRKISKDRIDELATLVPAPTSPAIVANPWDQYAQEDHQLILSRDGKHCLNWAGCLDPAEIEQRETDGINRAGEFVFEYASRRPYAPISLETIQKIHTEIFGDIYPWAGEWRTVVISKAGITWDVPFHDMWIAMKNFETNTLNQAPFLSDDDGEVLDFIARVLGEYIAIHPFREGNGRSAFLLSEIILLQNGMLPFDRHQRDRDQARYYAACEAARTRFDYKPLSDLFRIWQEEAQEHFLDQEGDHA